MRIVRTYRVVSVLEKIGALFGSESISVYVVGGMRRCHGEDLECESVRVSFCQRLRVSIFPLL